MHAQAEAALLAAGRARGAGGGAGREAAWNHGEFAVAYPSLAAHLCLGGVYVRLLLEGLDQARPCTSHPALSCTS